MGTGAEWRAGRSARAVLGLALVLVLPGARAALAEEPEPTRPLFFQEVGLTVGVPSGVTVAVTYTPSLGFWNRRLNVGLGARFSAVYGGEGVSYPNGNADLIRAGAADSFTVNHPSTYALNAMFALSVRLVAGLEVGLNIDLIGVGFGPGVTGLYQGVTLQGPIAAQPTQFNFLLLGKNDRGQLDSEFFAAYWFEHWGVRAGLSHSSTEYTLAAPVDGGNTTFRLPVTRIILAVGYRF